MDGVKALGVGSGTAFGEFSQRRAIRALCCVLARGEASSKGGSCDVVAVALSLTGPLLIPARARQREESMVPRFI